MCENLIKPVENGQFEGASTSAQRLNLKKKKSLPWPVARSQKKRGLSFSGPRISKKRGRRLAGLQISKKRSRRLAGPRISKKKKSPPGQAPDLKKKEVAALGRPAGAEFPATSFLFDEKRYRYLFSLRPAGPGRELRLLFLDPVPGQVAIF